MPRGRKPKPTNLKVLQGNPGKRKINKNEPKPEAGAPPCPAWLNDEARLEWERVTPLLDRAGILTQVDMAALAGYCQSYARYVQAEEVLQEKGLTMVTPSGYKQQRPEVSIAQKYLQIAAKFCAEFGMTPSSRSRMSVPGGQEEDSFEDFLHGRKKNKA